MDNSYQHGQSEHFQPPAYTGGHLQTRYTASEPRGPTLPDPSAPSWTPPPAFDGQQYGLRYDFPPPPPGGAAFGGPLYPDQYRFDPSVPPPHFDYHSPGSFPGMAPPGPVNSYSSTDVSTFPSFSSQLGSAASPRYDSASEPDCGPRQRLDPRGGGDLYWGGPYPPQDRDSCPEDEEAAQRRRDKQWLEGFLRSRGTTTGTPQTRHRQQPNAISVSAFRDSLYGSVQLLSQLEELCQSLKHNLQDDTVWADSYLKAFRVKEELQDKLKLLSDAPGLQQLKVKASRATQKRARRLRARQEQRTERKQAEERRAEKEAAIDKWRMRQIQQVEEKKKARVALTYIFFTCALR